PQATDVGTRLRRKALCQVGRHVSGPDTERPIPTAQMRDPLSITAQVALTGPAQAAGVSVDDPERRQAAIGEAEDAAAVPLGDAVELNGSNARLTQLAGGQRRQSNRPPRLAQAEQRPARLLPTAGGGAMAGIILK